MASAKKKMLDILLKNVGKKIKSSYLSEIAGVSDWPRALRTLRQEGWDLTFEKDGYILRSENKKENSNQRLTINNKLRYSILQRDLSTCQRCGKTVADKVKLEIDHKIPVEWGGNNDIENLWTLCNLCNGGKKHFFADYTIKDMPEIMKESSGYQKLQKLFERNPNVNFEPIMVEVISGIRDWTRTIRHIRDKKRLNIVWIEKCEQFPQGAYCNRVLYAEKEIK